MSGNFSPSAFSPLLTPIQADSARLRTNQNERNFIVNLLIPMNMYCKVLEARVGIEPTHKGFADLSLTTWVPRPFRRTTVRGLPALHGFQLCFAKGRSIGCGDWSGRRDLNPRPSPWQGDALPLSYSRVSTL